MERNNLVKRGVVVAIIFLFIGLAFAPPINAIVSKTSVEDELVEFTTEVCGLNGGKQTVQLTHEEAEEVEQLFDSINERLDEVETREETVEIFNETVVELDNYGLLVGLSIEQALNLVLGNYNKISNLGSLCKNLLPYWENVLCLLSGHGSILWYYEPHYIIDISPMLLFGLYSAVLLSYLGLENLANIFFIVIFLLNERIPLKLMNTITFFNFDLDITSIGLKGHVTNKNHYSCFLVGFSGLIYQNSDDTVHFLGSAIAYD